MQRAGSHLNGFSVLGWGGCDFTDNEPSAPFCSHFSSSDSLGTAVGLRVGLTLQEKAFLPEGLGLPLAQLGSTKPLCQLRECSRLSTWGMETEQKELPESLSHHSGAGCLRLLEPRVCASGEGLNIHAHATHQHTHSTHKHTHKHTVTHKYTHHINTNSSTYTTHKHVCA